MRGYSFLTPTCGAFLLTSRISFALAIAYGATASMVAIPVANGQAHPSPDPPAGKKMDAPAVAYESPFKGYRKFEDQPVASWREANDLVHQLGGWKAFASGKVPDDPERLPRDAKPAQPADKAQPAQSPPPAAAGHSGHKTK